MFVGNLTADADQASITERFQQYGAVQQVQMLKNYCFVEFSNPQSARAAMQAEDGKNFMGKSLAVKPARTKDQGGPGLMGMAPKQQQHQRQGLMGPGPAGFPFGDGGGQNRGPSQPQQQLMGMMGGGGGAQQYPQGNFNMGNQQQQGFGNFGQQQQRFGNAGGGSGGGPFGGGGGGPMGGPMMGGGGQQGPPPHRQGGPPPGQLQQEQQQKPPPPQQQQQQQQQHTNKPKVCDCEIVCVNRANHLYCESIETRLKALGMTVDVLFPTPGVQLRKILENIIGRGVMYAVLVTPENEQAGTVTVNKLQGQQSEKLNIPVDAALKLLANDFGSGVRPAQQQQQQQQPPVPMDEGPDRGGSDLSGHSGGGGYGGGGPAQNPFRGQQQQQQPQQPDQQERRVFPGGGHPPDVMTVVDFLVDNRPLSVMEYDKLIRYLSQRRREMLTREYGDDIPAHLVTPPIGGAQADQHLKAKEEEFKAKILAVLSEPPEEEMPQQHQQSRPERTPSSAASSSIAPSLQSAIDSLFKGGGGATDLKKEGEDRGAGGSGGQYYGGGGSGGGGDQPEQQQDQKLFFGY